MWIVVLTYLSKTAVLPYVFVLCKLGFGLEGWGVGKEPWYAFFLLWGWKVQNILPGIIKFCVSVQFSNRTCQPTEFHCFMKMCVGTGNFLIGIDPNLKWNVWLWLFIENPMKQLTFFSPLEKIIFKHFKHLVGNPLQNRFMAWSLVHSQTGGNFAVDFHVAILLRFSLQQEGLCDSLSGGINVTSKLLSPLQK